MHYQILLALTVSQYDGKTSPRIDFEEYRGQLLGEEHGEKGPQIGGAMGNQMSVPLRTEEQENGSEADTYKVILDSECVQNGTLVMVSTHVVQHYDEVDLGISIPKDNVATSSPKTTEPNAVASASGKNLGKEASPKAPAARSRFFLTLSRSVPGRPGDQGIDSSAASGRLDVSPSAEPVNKDLSECRALPGAAAPRQAADKTTGWPQTEDQALPTTSSPAPSTPELGAEAPSRPKDFSFFDRVFKLDKGREKAPVDSQQQEVKRTEDQDKAAEAPIVPATSHGVPEGEVSPNKTEAKKDPEDKVSKADCVCDGQAGQKLETQTKGKKQILDSPRLGLTLRKLFRHKGTENSPTTSANLKSDKANFTPQEIQGASKSPKGCNPPGHTPPAATSDTTKEGGREKSGPASLPLGKLFWKKSVKEDSVSTGAEENVVCESPVETKNCGEVDSALQTVDLSEEDDRPEPAEVEVKEESKPRSGVPQSNLEFTDMTGPASSLFWGPISTSHTLGLRMAMCPPRVYSVRGSGGIAHSEEIKEKDSSCQTSNSTEKGPRPPEPEPAGAQKGTESIAKDKKAAAETSRRKSKSEAREPALPPPAMEANPLQNGDKPPKRAEKRRQSLGGFLKGLGPKRMLDAQVQTDPVSIGPVGKSK
ncbi:breast carcinoma-amplified sequence 1 [Nannospalax galili]|uniref:breast carcinoma-amplified sequence 1 n=1 Tax=Nannospalax galili TaxID=1026970 RepID=UPI00111C1ABE|nr:breast carcinoma-amplified sequence 1 [Nannospalax galili]